MVNHASAPWQFPSCARVVRARRGTHAEGTSRYEPRADYKLANYEEISGYFKKLAASSDRIRLVEYGKTSEGPTILHGTISSPDNLRSLDRYREMNKRLALGLADDAEAQKLAREGKAIVWIDSGLHASEGAGAAFTGAGISHGDRGKRRVQAS